MILAQETPKAKEQGHEDKNKFRQMYDLLATPNMYRTASGAPGPEYYQQQADYKMDVELDDKNAKLFGTETITYTNNAKESLDYLWIQLDQNIAAKTSKTPLVENSKIDQVLTMWNERVAWWDKKFPNTHKEGVKGTYESPTGPGSGGIAPPVPAPARIVEDAGSVVGAMADGAFEASASAERRSSPGVMAKRARQKQGKGDSGEADSAEISIKEWNPSTPYLKEIEAKGEKIAYETYLSQKLNYGTSPAFFLDCANYFFSPALVHA